MADPPLAFFSYSRTDGKFALRLAEDLKSAGANIWIDQLDIEPGTPWDHEIEEALSRCPRMLVILSPASANSDNASDEVAFALNKHKSTNVSSRFFIENAMCLSVWLACSMSISRPTILMGSKPSLRH